MGTKRRRSPLRVSLLAATFSFFVLSFAYVYAADEDLGVAGQQTAPSPVVPLIGKEQRRMLITTESGVVSTVVVPDGHRGPYHLQFFSLDPNSLFLPVFLHTDMVFYVDTGKGSVSWIESEDKKTTDMEVEHGDVYQISKGSVFYIRSHSNPMREKLRINAMFAGMKQSSEQEQYQTEADVFPYSHLSDLIRGFDEEILQKGFNITQDDVQGIRGSPEQPAPRIITYPQHKSTGSHQVDGFQRIELVTRRASRSLGAGNASKNKKKAKPYNIFKEKPDVKNEFGWSITVTKKDLSVLKESDIGVFMVNLTQGSMMSPHWNPMATEITVATQGEGMVQVVNPPLPAGSVAYPTGISARLHVEAGDVFTVQRYHPMAHMAFNTSSFVFMGFTTSSTKTFPQFFAGKKSVLHALDKDILAMSFDVPNTTIGDLLAAQDESIILSCPGCAEVMKQEQMERQQEEAAAAARREEEERRRQQEEEEARRQQEEQQRRREQEEEQRRREQEEEQRRREQEEEAARRQQEEQRRQQQEQEQAMREEEEMRRQQEMEEARRREEEQAAQQQQEEAMREEEQRRQQEEEAMRQQQEEEQRRRQEEEAMRQQQEEEQRRRQEEEQTRLEEEAMRQQQEEEQRRRQEEEQTRMEEEAMRQQQEEEQRRRQEEKQARMEEEERRRQEEEAGEGGSGRFGGGQQGEGGGGREQGEGETQAWGGQGEGGGWEQGQGEQQPWGGQGGGGGEWEQGQGEQQPWGGQGGGEWEQGQGQQQPWGGQGGGGWEQGQGEQQPWGGQGGGSGESWEGQQQGEGGGAWGQQQGQQGEGGGGQRQIEGEQQPWGSQGAGEGGHGTR